MAAMKQMYPTVRISAETHRKLKQMADEESISMSDVIEKAVEQYLRQRIANKANEVWAEAVKAPELRKFWEQEDALLEGTLMDGLEDRMSRRHEWWYEVEL